MQKKRIVFAGTPSFSAEILKALINAGYNIVAAYTQPDRPKGRGNKLTKSPVKELAELHNIPVFQPKSLRNEDAQSIFKGHSSDMMIVVAYGLILPKTVLEIPTFGCVNIHASLLPRWRGAAPIQRAIESGDKESGVCIMQMDEGLDTGAVWSRESVDITETTTSGSLFKSLESVGSTLLLKTLPEIFNGKIQAIPQEEAGVTYAEKIRKEEARIDWDRPVSEIDRKIRAFNPAPVTYTIFNELVLKVWEAEPVDECVSLPAGALVVKDKQLLVTTGDQKLLRLKTIQFPGKRAMAVEDLIHGYNFKGGHFQ